MSAPLSPEQVAEIVARVEAAEDGWHVVPDETDPHRFEIHGDGPTAVAVFGGDSYPVRENAEFAAHARQDVPALLAEVNRLRAEFGNAVATVARLEQKRVELEKIANAERERVTARDEHAERLARELVGRTTDLMAAEARVAELEAERHATNEALDDSVKAIAEKNKRITDLEDSPLAWAEQLDIKSLDNFLITLAQATEYEPLAGAICEIHEVLASFRNAVEGGEHA